MVHRECRPEWVEDNVVAGGLGNRVGSIVKRWQWRWQWWWACF